jgi:hypothetical protein
MASLIEFLKTGRFGPITCGMSLNDVRAVLGEPDDYSIQKNPLIYNYGPLSLSFYRSPEDPYPSLVSITLYGIEPEDELPTKLSLSGWVPAIDTTIQEFRQYLDAEGLSIGGGVLLGHDQHFVLESSVRVTCDGDRLHSISFSDKREPDFKQLSVRIRRDDLDLIQRWAKSRHISASALCSEWIREKVSRGEKLVEKLSTQLDDDDAGD